MLNIPFRETFSLNMNRITEHLYPFGDLGSLLPGECIPCCGKRQEQRLTAKENRRSIGAGGYINLTGYVGKNVCTLRSN